MTTEKVEDIVLYHGSLEELNSRSRGMQYQFHKDISFFHEVTSRDDYRNKNELLDFVRRDLLKKGYHGLVNVHTHFQSEEGCEVEIEGTPIVRKEELTEH